MCFSHLSTLFAIIACVCHFGPCAFFKYTPIVYVKLSLNLFFAHFLTLSTAMETAITVLEAIHKVAEIATPFFPVIGVGLPALSWGLGHRAGPGRAFGLAFRSRVFRRAIPLSARLDEVNVIRSSVGNLSPQEYLVVVGEKGVGKSCTIHGRPQPSGCVVLSK